MNLKALLNKINAKKDEVKNLVSEGKTVEAKAAKDELIDLQNQFDILVDLEDGKQRQVEDNAEQGKVKTVTPNDEVAKFIQAARECFPKNSMSEGVLVDGGYTVPEDIRTKIEKYRDAKFSLIDLVDVEKVTTNKGSRTFKKRAQQTGFSLVGEGGKIGAKNTPQFERISYEIKKYAGYFPVTNELLDDSDANIEQALIEWIGDESRVTRNKLIRDILKTKSVTALAGLDDIKKALNKTLGSAFKNTSSIVTNDDGLQWLDTLKDDNGKYLLQPSPADPMKLVLTAGASVIPVKIIPNDDLPSNTTTPGTVKIPFFIGDLKEAVKFFDRKQLTINSSNIASAGDLNAFEEDLTLFRAIEREDIKIKDSKAYVYGEMSITE